MTTRSGGQRILWSTSPSPRHGQDRRNRDEKFQEQGSVSMAESNGRRSCKVPQLNGNTHERALASQASSFHAANIRNVLLKRVCGCSRTPEPVLDFSDSPSASTAREVCCASQIAQEVSKLLRSAVRVCARDGFQFRCCSMAWLRAMLSCISLS